MLILMKMYILQRSKPTFSGELVTESYSQGAFEACVPFPDGCLPDAQCDDRDPFRSSLFSSERTDGTQHAFASSHQALGEALRVPLTSAA